MSTKATLKSRDRTDDEPGFQLYFDVFDEMTSEADGTQPPVYLCLEGVDVELQTLPRGGATITFKLPRETARALGLVSDPAEAPMARPR